MKKEEFLNTLRECLQNEIGGAEIQDTLTYYRSYFAEEEANGRTEEEISQSLGSPRLIAHSIIDAHEENSSRGGEYYYDASDAPYQEVDAMPSENGKTLLKNIFSKVWVVIGLIAVLMVLGTVLKMLMPVLILVVLFWAVSRIFRK